MLQGNLPMLEGKGKYLQFDLAYQEETKDFANSSGVFEGDRNKSLQLIKDATIIHEDTKLVNNMYDLDEALRYLDTRYNNDGILSKSGFNYLHKLGVPKDFK